ncbi:Phosphate ABC transporter, periplasmic phosphate-binding protein [Nitrospira sp. KM1]|uniref:PstS family phosphate ABC transporter substrate-binding protein n=1 Tax=Nitrospira sp. KM1 TaxID=1936990 RepID=UPI0013A77845|nr:phosphate ABC transporter substrate-binding protein [Nitrospira sp. KM1]BCA54634.1 Phosphate ABC transporter, periplasmic phosphate-binding protein [Nitrospira sp. KM1]
MLWDLGRAMHKHREYRTGLMTVGVCLLAFGSVSHAEHEKANYGGAFVDPSLSSYSAESTVSGRMTIAGSDTMQPVLSKLAMEFRRRHPDIKLAIQGSRDSKLTPEQVFITGISTMRRGDGDTAGHFGAYDVQILASSRPLMEKELSGFKDRYGYTPLAIPIAQDALAVYVNQNNPTERLTLAQIDAMFSGTRKRGLPEMTEWGQLGLDGNWEHAPIQLFGRDQRSTGTLPFFKHAVLLDGEFTRSVIPQPGSASIVIAVGKSDYAIGYSGIGFQTTAVKPVAVAEGVDKPYIFPTAETVMSGEYPLSRPLYLYVNKNPSKVWDPKALEFLRFINSREGQETVSRTGVYPLSSSQLASNQTVLQNEALRASR